MKITQWLLKTVLTVVLISGLTVMTTGAVVNMYVQSLLASFNIQLEGQPVGLGGIMKGMLGMKTENAPKKNLDPTPVISNSEEDGAPKSTPEDKNPADAAGTATEDMSSAGSTGGTGGNTDPSTGNHTGTEGNSSGSSNPPEDSLPVMGSGISESAAGESAGDQQVLVSPDDMVKKKDGLTASEKDQIFNILMKKLPQSELQNISSAMEDGLTEQELSTIEDTISKYLSKEEYATLKAMLEQQ